MLGLNYEKLIKATLAAKLTQPEIISVRQFVEGAKDPYNFYGTPEFGKLFEYFTVDTMEMPYDIAKARTGDPDIWILDYFTL